MHRSFWVRAGTMLVLALVVGVLATSAESGRKTMKTISPAPAWSDAQLSAPAGDNWLEYYGDLSADRYSSLNQITTSNVSQLKQVWQMSLGTCTASIIAGNPVVPGANKGSPNNPTNCGSMESNPVAIDGVLYTTNAPLGQVFAIDAATGNIIWEYTPSYAGETQLNGSVYSPGSGGRLPGVAVAEGKVFAPLPDGRLVALDQTTGSLVWENNVGSYKLGNRISTAPIYVDGMVIVGDGAGDNGGPDPNMTAFSAASGARIWSFNPIPQKGQPGYNTWSNKNGNGSTAFGGGAFWQSPIINTKLGLLFVGTGNPEPWNSRGAGTNLYTCSIVALDLFTGKMKWYFQQVHHDMWDSDLPNNGVLFTGKFKVKGKMVTRPAVSYVNKVGMTFVLDQADRQAADPGEGDASTAGQGAGREHLADTANPGHAERPLQSGRQGRHPVHDSDGHERARHPVRDRDGAGRQAVQDRMRVHALRHEPVRRDAVRDDGLAVQLVRAVDPLDGDVRGHGPRDGSGADPDRVAGRERLRRSRGQPARRGRRLDAGRELGQLHRPQRPDRQVHLAPALVGDLLLRLG